MDTLVLLMSEDRYQGDAQFTVTVDGRQVGGTQTATASHSGGQSQAFTFNGQWGNGPHTVVVNFLNDAYGGNSATDRNLYVDGISYDGTGYPADTANLYSNGPVSFAVGSAQPAPTPKRLLLGVNLAGLEFGTRVPGTFGVDYIAPTHAEIDYYASKGLGVIRLPFLWERVQPTEFGALNASYLGYIDDVVNYATSKGLTVDLDLHNYGYGYGSQVGSSATPNSAFADLWGKLAAHFKGNAGVMFGLMNEPHDQTAQQWAASANAAIGAIRSTGATQEILVSGTAWDGGWTWTSSGNASALGSTIYDPQHNFAFEVHQYLDPNGSGMGVAPITNANLGLERLVNVTNWAAQTGNRLFLGEFDVPSDPQSLTAMNNMLAFMQSNSNVWQGATYWAGGPWWGPSPTNIEPTGSAGAYTDAPQMGVLTQFVSHQ